MKAISSIVLSLFFITNVFAQAERTFVKSFNLNDNTTVALNLEGKVEIKEWSEDFLRVHTNVLLENASSEALKLFLMQGRYILKPQNEGSFSITSIPRPANVKFRGQVLEEKVTYTIFVPKNVIATQVKEKGNSVALQSAGTN